MTIKIGAPPSESLLDQPLALLYSCHRRVEFFLESMRLLTQTAQGTPLKPEQRHALESALRYFREAAPKHTLDEEDSLFPRMQNIQNPQIKAVIDTLADLKQGHRDAKDDHENVDQWVHNWLDQGCLPAKTHARLSKTLKRLSDFYKDHIKIEETKIFPLAEKMLTPREIKAIGQEMAIRRGLDPNALKEITAHLQQASRPT